MLAAASACSRRLATRNRGNSRAKARSIARPRSRDIRCHELPAAGPPLVLFGEVALQRLEVLEQRSGIHLAGARDRLERVGPGLAGPHREHRLQLRTSLLAAEDRAGMQRTFVTGGVAQG